MTYNVISAFTYVFLFASVETEINLTEFFEIYKSKYHREYLSPLSEQKAFYNFVNNMKYVEDHNNETTGNFSLYVLNRYADLNPEEIKEHFEIELKPYEIVTPDPKDTKAERQRKWKFLEELNLYDLFDVDDAYEEWMKKWGKSNSTKKKERSIHYLRFVKSVVEINKKKFEGEDITLGPDADVVREPDEYFYG